MKASISSGSFLLLLAIFTSAALSCEKSSNMSTPSQSSNTQTAQQKNALLTVTNAVFQSGSVQDENVSDGTDAGTDGGAPCRTVTYNPTSKTYPYQATIDFGTTGCLGSDGVTRKGIKIVTHYANPSTAVAGTELYMITYNNYWEDSSQLQGNIKVYVKTAATPGPLVLEYLENQVFSATNGSVIAYYGTHDWTQIAGGSTGTSKDNVFSITGSSTGSEILDGATTLTFTATVDNFHPVIKPASCLFRTQGAENVSLHLITGGGGNFTEYLDYGNGACDNLATLSINGGTAQQVSLPLQYWPLSL